MKEQMKRIYVTIEEEANDGDVLNDEVKKLSRSLWTTSEKLTG